MQTNQLKSFTTGRVNQFGNYRGKKPKLIHCCDISLRNELAVGHEQGDISLWKLDFEQKAFHLLTVLRVDTVLIKQIEFSPLATLVRQTNYSKGAQATGSGTISPTKSLNSPIKSFDLLCLTEN